MTSTVAQACINIAAALGAISAPLIIGALTKNDIENGWRKFYVRKSVQGMLRELISSSVDSNGPLGSDSNLHLHWLPTPEKTHATRPSIFHTKAAPPRPSWVRVAYDRSYTLFDWLESWRWSLSVDELSHSKHTHHRPHHTRSLWIIRMERYKHRNSQPCVVSWR